MQPEEMVESDTKGHYKIDDVFDMIGFGKMHFLVFLTSGLFVMYCNCETVGMGMVSPSSYCDLHMSDEDSADLMTSTFIGIILSAYYMGYLSDVYGRRKVLLCTSPFSFLCSAISTLMPNENLYSCMRVVTGIFLAGPVVTALAYVGEFCTNKHRAKVVNYTSMFNGIGMIYFPIIAKILLAQKWRVELKFVTYRPWRLLALSYLFPGIIAYTLLIFLPESPRYCMAAEKHQQAFNIMNRISKLNMGKSLNDLGITDFEKFISSRTYMTKFWLCGVWLDLGPVFHSRGYIFQFGLSCLVVFGISFVVNGVGLWYSDLRNRIELYNAVHTDDMERTVCEKIITFPKNNGLHVDTCIEYVTVFGGAIVMGVCFVIGYNILGALLFYFRRKVIFITALIIASLNGFSLSFGHGYFVEWVCPIFFMGLPNILMNFLNSAVMDHFPTNLRNKALSVVMTCGRLGTVTGCHIGVILIDNMCTVTFIFFPFIFLVCAALAMLLIL